MKANLEKRISRAFIEELATKGDVQIIDDIKSGKIQIRDHKIYIRRQLTGGGIQDILRETNTKEAGITNIDKNRLPKGQYFMLKGISLAYGTAVAAIPPASPIAIAYTKINMPTHIPVIPFEVLNAELSLQVSGTKLIDELPIKDLFLEGSFEAVNEEKGIYLFEVPKLIPAEQIIQIQMNFGVNTLPVANDHYVEVNLHGLVTNYR
jgi:hypothetical protein